MLLGSKQLAPLLYATFIETEDPPLIGAGPWQELLLETQARWVRMATLLNNRLTPLKDLEGFPQGGFAGTTMEAPIT
jgi:hypothetical protein